jgi:hypothetical protein
VLQGVSNGAKRAGTAGIQLFMGQPGASFEEAQIGPAVVAKQGCECIGKSHMYPHLSLCDQAGQRVAAQRPAYPLPIEVYAVDDRAR